MTDSQPIMAWRCRPDGSVEFFNRRWLEYTGWSLDEALGWGWTGAIHPDDLEQLMNRWRVLVASGESGQMEARLRNASGEYRWFLIRIGPSRKHGGEIVKWYGTATDIEELKRTDSLRAAEKMIDEIRRSEAKLCRVIDTIPALAWFYLPDGSMEFLNKRWHDFTGLSPEMSRGGGWQRAVHPEDVPRLIDRGNEARASGESGEIEVRLRRHDGVFRWFLIRAEPLRDEMGQPVKWYGTSTDIEDRKRAEEKLRQDEREFRRITDAIPESIVVLDPDGATLYVNQAVLDYTGLTIEDVTTSDFRVRIFHPEDVERLSEEGEAAEAAEAEPLQRTPAPGQACPQRLLTPDASTRPAQMFEDLDQTEYGDPHDLADLIVTRVGDDPDGLAFWISPTPHGNTSSSSRSRRYPAASSPKDTGLCVTVPSSLTTATT